MATTRRRFMVLALSGVGAAMLGVGCGGDDAEPSLSSDVPPDEEPFVPDVDEEMLPQTRIDLVTLLTSWFEGADLAAIGAIGLAYLQRFVPDESAVVEDLSELLAPLSDEVDVAVALEALDASVISDFESVALASVRGWQLSVTEARLCALVSLNVNAQDAG